MRSHIFPLKRKGKNEEPVNESIQDLYFILSDGPQKK